MEVALNNVLLNTIHYFKNDECQNRDRIRDFVLSILNKLGNQFNHYCFPSSVTECNFDNQ